MTCEALSLISNNHFQFSTLRVSSGIHILCGESCNCNRIALIKQGPLNRSFSPTFYYYYYYFIVPGLHGTGVDVIQLSPAHSHSPTSSHFPPKGVRLWSSTFLIVIWHHCEQFNEITNRSSRSGRLLHRIITIPTDCGATHP